MKSFTWESLQEAKGHLACYRTPPIPTPSLSIFPQPCFKAQRLCRTDLAWAEVKYWLLHVWLGDRNQLRHLENWEAGFSLTLSGFAFIPFHLLHQV
jgi:hypothetical protein